MSKKEIDKQRKNGKNKPKKKKRKIFRKILLFILILLIIGAGLFAYRTHQNGGGLSGMLATVVGHDETTLDELETLQVLILGISTDQEGVLLSDTIMVASYNPKDQQAVLLSIPRDTYTGNNVKKATASEKINAVYALSGDPMETVEAVNELTGLNIKYYVIVENDALIELVDAVGPIEFDVPIDMDYDDPTQDLHIHLEAGVQLIDGEKAEQLLRFRKNNDGTSFDSEYGSNDIGRMRTQRDFIMATIQQTVKLENITKLGQVIEIAKNNLTSNMDLGILADYLPYAVNFSTDNLQTATLPGTVPNLNTTNGVSIYVVDAEETEDLIQQLFFPDTTTDDEATSDTEANSTDSENTTNSTTNSTKSTLSASTKRNLDIEVLNGTGSSATLKKVLSVLEDEGYDVSDTGNVNDTSKTTIIYKDGISSEVIEDLKTVLDVEYASKTTSSSSADITIIIGTDF